MMIQGLSEVMNTLRGPRQKPLPRSSGDASAPDRSARRCFGVAWLLAAAITGCVPRTQASGGRRHGAALYRGNVGRHRSSLR